MDLKMGQELLAALQKRVGGRIMVCVACGGTRWSMNGFIMQSLQDQPSGLVIGGPAMPMVALACDICGHNLYFNALVLLGKERLEQILQAQQGDEILRKALDGHEVGPQ